jgi:hypothetical protein
VQVIQEVCISRGREQLLILHNKLKELVLVGQLTIGLQKEKERG